jgi:hypothetical protein
MTRHFLDSGLRRNDGDNGLLGMKMHRLQAEYLFKIIVEKEQNVPWLPRSGLSEKNETVGGDVERRSIMISELGDYNGLVLNLINNAMFIGDSAGPISGEAMSQGFRFPYSLIRYPFNGMY